MLLFFVVSGMCGLCMRVDYVLKVLRYTVMDDRLMSAGFDSLIARLVYA